MTSTLLSADGKVLLSEAARGTVTRHYHLLQRGEKTSTNPIAAIFSWSCGLAHRAQLDGNERLAEFARALEEACVTCVRHGLMSRDLAFRTPSGADTSAETWLNTEDFMKTIANELRLALSKPRRRSAMAQDVPFADCTEGLDRVSDLAVPRAE